MGIDQLTRRQKEVLDFIRDKIQNRGYGPTVREIGEGFDISSPNGVMCHLKALEKKGLITREPNMSRAIQLTEAALGDRGMPLVGQIAAGGLAEAIEQAERFEFTDWFHQKNLFALKVKGDSMIDEQIRDGDLVVVEDRQTAHNGEMVIALLEGAEVTLKKFYRENGHIRLQPANDAVAPIIVRADKVQVQGVVVGVIRRY